MTEFGRIVDVVMAGCVGYAIATGFIGWPELAGSAVLTLLFGSPGGTSSAGSKK
ncbi:MULTISPECIES: hypothetical protein [Rhodomicrobium]|uniref:hypothetical protein n=1 Tax=Rhodomicrobium TaxID=1068 RepID=UPI001483BCC3|nr:MULTISPECIES: hypothetical protein [Rhodomicrobium]